MKKYSLYLDDIRSPGTKPPVGKWVIARSNFEFLMALKEYGVPVYISFDHDLGEHEDAIDIVKSFISLDQTHIEKYNEAIIPLEFSFNVHSANPVGAKNIEALLSNYLAFRKRHLLP